MYYEQVRYTFNSSLGKYRLSTDPKGWDEVELTIARSKRSDAIFTEIKQGLEFTLDARSYLQQLESKEGCEAVCSIIRERFDGLKWEIVNEGYLDFSTTKWNEITITADYIENTFSELFKNSFSNEYEVDRLTDINGNELEPVDFKNLYLPGKEIFLQNKLDNSTDRLSSLIVEEDSDIRARCAFPAIQVYATDPLTSGFVSATHFSTINATASEFIYGKVQGTRILNLKIEGSFNITDFVSNNLQSNNLEVVLSIYDPNLSNENRWIQENVLYSTSNPNSIVGVEVSVSFDQEITLEQDQSIYFGWRFNNNRADDFFNARCGFESNHEHVIEITENSYFESTNTDCLTLFQIGERLTKIIDKEAVFKSDYLSSGPFKDAVAASGETVRKMLYDNEKPSILTASFEDLYDFLYTLDPVGFDVTLESGVKTIRLEKLSYFFDNTQPIINLGTAIEAEYETEVSWLFSRISIGYPSSGKREEVFGTQITHVENKYDTPITTVNNEYKATNVWISDPTEKELTRRKQYEDFPDEDTDADKKVLVYDGQQVTDNQYVLRQNDVDFSNISGIFSPETGNSYRFSPINCLLRHGQFLLAGMTPIFFNGKEIRYASTEGNNNLKTELIGGDALQESDNVPISRLEKPIFKATKIKIEVPYTLKLDRKLRGLSNGKKNVYSLMKFKDKSNNFGYGYLYKADVKDSIKIELIQANGI